MWDECVRIYHNQRGSPDPLPSLKREGIPLTVIFTSHSGPLNHSCPLSQWDDLCRVRVLASKGTRVHVFYARAPDLSSTKQVTPNYFQEWPWAQPGTPYPFYISLWTSALCTGWAIVLWPKITLGNFVSLWGVHVYLEAAPLYACPVYLLKYLVGHYWTILLNTIYVGKK